MKHFELQVPNDYKIDKVINCEKQSTIFIFTLVNLIVTVALIALGIIISFRFNENIKAEFEGFYALLGILFLVLIVIVVIGTVCVYAIILFYSSLKLSKVKSYEKK